MGTIFCDRTTLVLRGGLSAGLPESAMISQEAPHRLCEAWFVEGEAGYNEWSDSRCLRMMVEKKETTVSVRAAG